MKKCQLNSSDSKEININLLYEVPTNQTPEDLLRIDTSFTSLRLEVQRLQDVLMLQNSQISKIETKINETKQENEVIKTEISKVKLNTKRSSRALNDYNYDEDFNRKEKLIKDCLGYSGIKNYKQKELQKDTVDSENRINKLYKILKQSNEEYLMLEKRLDVAEGLLGFKLR
ncbi:hypothetical protein SteCoe_23801 [Stentor coeruleus]|uniref:Uncharacterized protein n=1 Tax=Stentor coeruleus TaxID=5963 RepID=A0A1R2BIY9_9CILI|nr:hypothetical protein SteCoe_23801 [Stentor coeruleus]